MVKNWCQALMSVLYSLANECAVLQRWPNYRSSSGEWIWLLCKRQRVHEFHQGGKKQNCTFISTITGSSHMRVLLFTLFSLLSFTHTLLFTLFQRKINSNISERTSSVLFSCLHIPPSFQALLSRGITELLLTSDNKEGLKLGGVKGGIVRCCGSGISPFSASNSSHCIVFFSPSSSPVLFSRCEKEV